MNLYKTAACVLALSILSGCANSGTALQVGDLRFPATDPTSISILLAAPTRAHVVIGLVDSQASTDDYLTRSRTQAAAVRILKEQAAKLGAHSIILTAKGSRPYGEMTFVSSTGSAFIKATSTGSANEVGNSVYGQSQSAANISAFMTSTASTFGWELIQLGGTAVRYNEN